MDEQNQIIPPSFIRYRFGLALDKIDLTAILADEQDGDLTPSLRFRLILIDLITYIKNNIDVNALIVSWQNSTDFSTLAVEPGDFPRDLDKIATFFNGYKANLKETTKNFFQFCLHSPGRFDSWVEEQLKKWGEQRSITIYKCILQAENSKTIGWLVYSTGFTNQDAIKRYLRAKADHEWGINMNVITKADRTIEWKNRLKAIQLLVPSEYADTAKEIAAEAFSQQPSGRKYKGLQESYMFVGNEHNCRSNKLATIFAAMVVRQRFRLLHINITFVQHIAKDIDTRITTKNKEELTLREMILDIPSQDQGFGIGKLFQSIDFCPDPSKVWFQNVNRKDDGGPGYYLSFYEWDTAQALHVSEGLRLFLGQSHGKTGIYEYFTENHWIATEKWTWNKKEMNWETPEQIAMAANVIHDPTAQIMIAYNKKKNQGLPTEISIPDSNVETTSTNGKAVSKSKEVSNVLTTSTEQNTYAEQDKLAEAAYSVARSIQSRSTHDESSSDSSSQSSTLSQLARKRAANIYVSEIDPDLNSIENEAEQQKDIRNVIADEQSAASSLTDLTNNTKNNIYHNGEEQSDGSVVSSLSIRSLKESDLEELVNSAESPEEAESTLLVAYKLHQKRQDKKIEKHLARIRERKQVQQSNQSTELVRGKQKENNENVDNQHGTETNPDTSKSEEEEVIQSNTEEQNTKPHTSGGAQ